MPATTPRWSTGTPLRPPGDRGGNGADLVRTWTDGLLVDRFEARVAANPDAVAVDDGIRSLTYRQLRDHAAALSRTLAALPDDGRPVAALMSGTVHYAVALLAAIAAGRALVPVDMGHPLERRRAILDEARPGILLLDPGLAVEPGLASGDRLQIQVLPDICEPGPWAEAVGDPIIGVAFTSGSMGRPKGLAYRQSAIFAMVAEHVGALAVGPDDVILSLASLGAGGNQDILSAILTGARVRLLDLKSVGIAETLRVMTVDGVTLLAMIPLVLRTLMAQEGAAAAFARMRAVTTGGDRLFGKDIDLFRQTLPPHAAIRVTQGSTETGVVFQWIVPAESRFDAEQIVPSGRISPSHEVALTSPDGDTPHPDVDEGELIVSGRYMAAGAWQAGRLTPGPFVSALDDGDRRVFDSGDIMRRRSDGLFEFVGRRDRQIKMRGLRSDPGEVEAALRRMADVDDVAVVPRYTGPEAVFVAYVVPGNLYAPPSAASLRSSLADEVPPHMIPAEVRFLQSLPRLPNYKTDYAALTALDQASLGAALPESTGAPGAKVAHADPAIEAAVSAAWTEVLGSHPPERPFDQCGGDSLKLLQLALHLEEGLDRRLPLDLFELGLSQTALAERLSVSQADSAGASSEKPTVVLCPGLGGDEPRLAAFRRALQGRFRFVVIDYPGLEDSPARLGDLDRMVDAALRQAEMAVPSGPVALAGYSAGGLVALEMGRRFQAMGRPPAFTALIDLSAVRGPSRDTGHVGASLADVFGQLTRRGRTAGFAPTFTNWAFFFLLRLRAFGLLRLLVLTKSRLRGAHSVTYVRKVLLEYMRGPAILSWRPARFHGDLTLFRAESQRDPMAPEDLGWTAWCDSLTVHRVPGDHLSILSSPNVEQLATRFDAAFNQSLAVGQTAPFVASSAAAR